MKLAIMQPYFVPYLGYFQLMATVNKFVLLDDVNYINRGWINRNRISLDGKQVWLTVPLAGASQNRLIHEIDIFADPGWKSRQAKLVAQAFAKAPYGAIARELHHRWLNRAEGRLSAFLYETLCDISRYLGIDTEIVPSSTVYPKNGLNAHHRILDICRREGADVYVNPPGGVDLYDKHIFAASGIHVVFLQPDLHPDTLRNGGNDAFLSMLELIAYNSPAVIKDCLRSDRPQAACSDQA
jgi:hypothetical protein